MKRMAEAGNRIIVVDPITILDAGRDRWANDDAFIDETQRLAVDYGISIVLVTHARKGNRVGQTSGHDMAGGAAYHRFTDTSIWIHKPKLPRLVMYQSKMGPAKAKMGMFFQLTATRNGKGHGMELAYSFGDGLKFAEQGIVLKEIKQGEQEDE
jgi:hypothetical protein